VSDDLSAWTSLGVFTNETDTLEVTDREAGQKPYRFYRAVSRQMAGGGVVQDLLSCLNRPASSTNIARCVLNIRAGPNQGWQIQASSDLVAWQALTKVTNTTVGFQHTDTTAVGVGSRFYRVGSE